MNNDKIKELILKLSSILKKLIHIYNTEVINQSELNEPNIDVENWWYDECITFFNDLSRGDFCNIVELVDALYKEIYTSPKPLSNCRGYNGGCREGRHSGLCPLSPSPILCNEKSDEKNIN